VAIRSRGAELSRKKFTSLPTIVASQSTNWIATPMDEFTEAAAGVQAGFTLSLATSVTR